MKKFITTLLALAAIGSVQAAGLTWTPIGTGVIGTGNGTPGRPDPTAGFNPIPNYTQQRAALGANINSVLPQSGRTAAGLLYRAPGSSFSLGRLAATESGTVTFTFLGKEAWNSNSLDVGVNTAGGVLGDTTAGSSVSSFINAGVVDFKFTSESLGSSINGGTPNNGWDNSSSIALIASNFTTTQQAGSVPVGSTFDYVLGWNDPSAPGFNGTDHPDWDDYVVGVKFAPAVQPIPEPETYALMLAGLTAVGFVARRRKSARKA
jgi:hypothetical protein